MYFDRFNTLNQPREGRSWGRILHKSRIKIQLLNRIVQPGPIWMVHRTSLGMTILLADADTHGYLTQWARVWV